MVGAPYNAPPEEAGLNPSRTDQLLIARLAAMLLSIPLMRLDLHFKFLPSVLSDFSFGMMSRLGVCFGLVVLVWHWGFRRQFFHWRSLLFLLASVLSARAAYWSDHFVPDSFGMLAIVITGAILLALSQRLLLNCSWIQVLAASVLAPGLFYLIAFSAALFPHDFRESMTNYWPYYWQVGYLLGMFVIPDFFEKSTLSSVADH